VGLDKVYSLIHPVIISSLFATCLDHYSIMQRSHVYYYYMHRCISSIIAIYQSTWSL